MSVDHTMGSDATLASSISLEIYIDFIIFYWQYISGIVVSEMSEIDFLRLEMGTIHPSTQL